MLSIREQDILSRMTSSEPGGSLASEIVSDSPLHELRKHPIISGDMSARDLCANMADTDWRLWLPLARPPFDNCTIEIPLNIAIGHGDNEFDSRDLLMTDPNLIVRECALIILNRHGMIVSRFQAKDDAYKTHRMLSPYIIDFDGVFPRASEFDLTYVWNNGYVKKFGMPDIINFNVDPKSNIGPSDLVDDRYLPCSAVLRPMLAFLALLNSQRETIVIPADQRDGKTWSKTKKRFIPRWKPHLVVIRPDAPRRVTERVQEIAREATRKREHEVRRHIRRLRDGREVWVRPHKRGDASLGVVEKKYLIESDPNKHLNR